MNEKRVDITCRCSLLVIFVMFLGCTLFFNHTHISEGNIIFHSHPFKADKDGKPLHNHGNNSYILIHILNNFIADITPVVMLAALLLFVYRELLGVIKESYPAGNGVLLYQQRGPPSIML